MVVNTHYRFVFVHIPKAAGTSVARWLSSQTGNNTEWIARTKHETLAEFDAAVETRSRFQDISLFGRPQDYFRFGFVRNPWDRMASLFAYMTECDAAAMKKPVCSFKDFLRRAADGEPWIDQLHSMRPQADYFAFAGRLRLDYLGHFEHLNDDLVEVAAKIACRFEGLPHLNRSSNARRDYRRDYDSAMTETVARRFTEDIALFGYEFDQRFPTRRCSAAISRPRAQIAATP